MFSLLYVIMLNVGDRPAIARILAGRVAAELTLFRSLKVFLTRILLGNSNFVQIENAIDILGEPQDRFVPARKSIPTMKAVFECPNYPVL